MSDEKVMSGREFQRRQLLARADEMERDLQLHKNTIQHWNSINPQEEPISDDFSDIELLIKGMREKLEA